MTGMTTDYAIAILRRMQEPDPYEPQINESAFDALEMAIQAIQKYSTWSQTYSNMVENVISRKAAVDVIHKYFAERIEQSPTHMTEDGEVYDLGICNPLLEDNKALSQAIKELPSAQPNSKDLVGKIKNGITASDGNSEYFIGLRNGMRWCLSLIDDKEPIYESSAQPSDEYERGWKEGREALREETWKYVRDRFDQQTGGD